MLGLRKCYHYDLDISHKLTQNQYLMLVPYLNYIAEKYINNLMLKTFLTSDTKLRKGPSNKQ